MSPLKTAITHVGAFRIDCQYLSCAGTITLSHTRTRRALNADEEFPCPNCNEAIVLSETFSGDLHDTTTLTLTIRG